MKTHKYPLPESVEEIYSDSLPNGISLTNNAGLLDPLGLEQAIIMNTYARVRVMSHQTVHAVEELSVFTEHTVFENVHCNLSSSKTLSV